MQSDGEFSHHSTTDDAESRLPGHWLSAGESKYRIYEINSIQAILFQLRRFKEQQDCTL